MNSEINDEYSSCLDFKTLEEQNQYFVRNCLHQINRLEYQMEDENYVRQMFQEFGVPISCVEIKEMKKYLPQMLSTKLYLIDFGDVETAIQTKSPESMFIFPVGHCVAVELPFDINQKKWALAEIQQNHQGIISYVIKFNDSLQFAGENPEEAVGNYENYYFQQTGDQICFNWLEVFGFLSPIVLAIWQHFGELNFHFANIIRFRPKALLPQINLIKSDKKLAHNDLVGHIIPSDCNFKEMRNFVEEFLDFEEKENNLEEEDKEECEEKKNW